MPSVYWWLKVSNGYERLFHRTASIPLADTVVLHLRKFLRIVNRRIPFRNRQRSPIPAKRHFPNKYNLPDMIGIMRQRPVKRLQHNACFVADMSFEPFSNCQNSFSSDNWENVWSSGNWCQANRALTSANNRVSWEPLSVDN
jgi:hypothetical protein